MGDPLGHESSHLTNQKVLPDASRSKPTFDKNESATFRVAYGWATREPRSGAAQARRKSFLWTNRSLLRRDAGCVGAVRLTYIDEISFKFAIPKYHRSASQCQYLVCKIQCRLLDFSLWII